MKLLLTIALLMVGFDWSEDAVGQGEKKYRRCVEPGDFQLSATIHENAMIGSVHDIQISVVKGKLDRIQAIESWVEVNKRAVR